MQSSNLSQNQEVPVVIPQLATPPRRRRVARWLTLVAVVFVVGSASVLVILRGDPANVVAASGATVKITAASFEPQTIKVRVGESVTWVNKDNIPHQIVADPYPSGDSLPGLNSNEPLAQGESYTAIFEQAGTFSYHDQLNPAAFKAVVIVE